MKISDKGLALIKRYEGCVLRAYLCPASKWTIGFGHTGPDVKPGLTITQAQADELLRKDVERFEREVTQLIGSAPTTQGQFDAMTCLAYNIGSDIDADTIPEGLGDSTLLRRHLQGDYARAANEFLKWNKARNKARKLVVLSGLTKRRAQERELYLGH
jgi:lysozyme